VCAGFAVSGSGPGLVRQLFLPRGLVAGHLADPVLRFAQANLGLSFQYAEVVGYPVRLLART